MKRRRTIKMQIPFGTDDEVLTQPVKSFVGEVNRLSAGKITVEMLPGGAVVAPFQVYDAAAKRLLDAGFSFPLYAYGKNSAFGLLDGGVPFGLDAEKLVRWYEGEGGSWPTAAYAKLGVKMLPCAVLGPGGIWHARPLTDASAYNGTRVRAVGLQADAFQAAGATVVQLPGGEVLRGLERGLIEGTTFLWPSADGQAGLQTQARYFYFPGWHQPAKIMDFVVGLSYWQALSAAERDVLVKACRQNLHTTLARIPQTEREGLEKIRRAGVDVRELPAQLRDHAKTQSENVLNNHAERNSDFRRIYESMSRFK